MTYDGEERRANPRPDDDGGGPDVKNDPVPDSDTETNAEAEEKA